MDSPARRVSISASEEDDEYHEDSLPDLVLDSFRSSGGISNREPNNEESNKQTINTYAHVNCTN